MELLVVASIVSLLVGLLLPSMRGARQATMLAICRSNLRQIYLGSISYATDFGNRFPDQVTTGRFSHRLPPGAINGGAGGLPEVYGWATVLDRNKHLPYARGVWVCPAQASWMRDNGITYAFSIAGNLSNTQLGQFNPKTEILWDNFTLYPGLTGFMGPFSGYNIPTFERTYAHARALPGSSDDIVSLRVTGEVNVRRDYP